MAREARDGEAIASPFDARVVFRAKRDDEGCEAPPEELACLSPRAVDSRRREFLRGRAAARLALQSLIGHAPPVGRGAHGEPLWPAGVVGSISHTRELAVAAVGWHAQVAGIGLDVESRDRRVAAGVAARVCLPEELRWVESSDEATGAPADPLLRLKMVFAAKEAIYKALFPVEQVFLGFKDAELRWDAPACRFRGELRCAAGAGYPAGLALEVGCRVLECEVLASLCLPPVVRRA
jgi:4'-phosphopantetheinyl transferase EntD